MEPYYTDESVTLYHADFRDLDGLGPAAAAVTSPPYNSGVAYDVHDDRMTPERYGELAAAAGESLFQALEESGGRAWVNVGVTQLATWLKALEAAGFAGTTHHLLGLRAGVGRHGLGLVVLAGRAPPPLRLGAGHLRLDRRLAPDTATGSRGLARRAR